MFFRVLIRDICQLKDKYLCGQYEMPQTRIRDGGVGNIQLSTKKVISVAWYMKFY